MTTPLQFSFLFNTQNFIQAGSLHIPCFYILSRPVRSLYSVILQFPPACVLALSMQAQKGKTITQPAKTRYPSHRSLQHTPPQYVSPLLVTQIALSRSALSRSVVYFPICLSDPIQPGIEDARCMQLAWISRFVKPINFLSSRPI